ncbi:hypothetical protein V2K41_18425 [Pseudomonas alliivorans]|uniref:hypothetical protein n=1 Tax=Pseudomonas fragariae (ex Marin et al. 2024) TaxID=3080056 RepID=UPI002ED4C2BE|nr:hypothetical protein [Pseudomonas alliivorans]
MPIYAKKITVSQRAWLEQYESQTGVEPMHQDELDNGEMKWGDVVQANVDWFEAWSMDTLLRIQKTNPDDQ